MAKKELGEQHSTTVKGSGTEGLQTQLKSSSISLGELLNLCVLKVFSSFIL